MENFNQQKKGGKIGKRKGFSLIGMVIVLAIMSILSLIAAPNLTAYVAKSNAAQIEANLNNLYTSAEIVHKTEGGLHQSIVEKYSNIIPVQIGEPTLEIYAVNIYSGKVVATYLDRDGKLFKHPRNALLENGDPGNPITPSQPEADPVDPGNTEDNPGDPEEDEEEMVQTTEDKYFTFDESSQTIKGYDPDGPKDVIIPNYINGVAVLKIGVGAFENMGIESVILPETLIDINAKAFSENNLKKLDIPNAVVHIRNSAFSDNIIQTIEIGDSVERIYNKAFYNNYLEIVKIPNTILLISNKAFENNGPNQNSEGIDTSQPGLYILKGTYWEK